MHANSLFFSTLAFWPTAAPVHLGIESGNDVLLLLQLGPELLLQVLLGLLLQGTLLPQLRYPPEPPGKKR